MIEVKFLPRLSTVDPRIKFLGSIIWVEADPPHYMFSFWTSW